MRPPRWKAPPEHPAGYYHCVSRVVDRRFAFEAREREKFRQFLSEYSAFCGVRILTWCILSNHFHLLVEVPRKPEEPPPLEDLIARLESLSSTVLSAGAARQLIARWQSSGDTQSPELLRRRLWTQMNDLIDRATVLTVLRQGGKLSRPEYLRLRVRSLVDGAVLGSREFGVRRSGSNCFYRSRSLFGRVGGIA